MKLNVHARFIFHNVGQGMFYTGDIYADKHLFRFVYDCGTSSGVENLRTAIERYRHDIASNPRIDLLILSHVHKDHTNGLDELMKNFRVKRVVLPYLSPIERLFIAVLESRIGIPAWYFTFLQDPVRFLLENGIEQVIFIGGGEDDRRSEEGGEGPPPTEFPKEGELRIELEDDRKLMKTIQENEKDPQWGELLERGVISVKTHHGHIIGVGLWTFHPFNYKVPFQDLQNFKDCVKNISCSNLKLCIIDSNLRSKLRECYTQHMHSLGRNENQLLNNTSLVIYHSPLYSRKNFILTPCLCPYHLCNWHVDICNRIEKYGHFLTGDINLNFKYSEFLQHFKRNINKVCVFNVPHHGALGNWNSQILKDISAPIWVISAGLNNRYRHPSRRVIKEICDHNRCALWVNEKSPLIIGQEVHW